MYKIALSFLFILVVGQLWSQSGLKKKTGNEISLTLIPPSEVTDQIILDIRAGIYNNSSSPKSFEVFFYLDEEKKEKSLFHDKITLNPKSAKGVKFPWSTKNREGDHSILLVCRSGSSIYRTKRP